MFLEYLWLLLWMAVFSLLAILIRALLDVWEKDKHFSGQIFIYENRVRMLLCLAFDLVVSLLWFFEPTATAAVVSYLGFGWVAGLGAALGFVNGLLTVVFKKSVRHPLREN